MFFSQLSAKESSLSYLFGCGGKGKAMAVDVVAGDEDWYITQAKDRSVVITHVIDTHVHADHYSGGKALAEKIGAKYCLHENADLEFPFEKLVDKQIIELGNVAVTVVHTPGHTFDSICLLVSDNRRTDEPWFVITGDTLFVGAVGRPDLAGREVEMAGMIFDSLHKHLLTLSNEVEIYPGHQAGSVCGAGLSGKPSSTIGFEKKFNPMLSMDRDEFISALTDESPPRPAEMDRMVQANTSA
ncbi:MAG: MBL fold metallo-hydrolase [Acidiferrobacterales bacterium]